MDLSQTLPNYSLPNIYLERSTQQLPPLEIFNQRQRSVLENYSTFKDPTRMYKSRNSVYDNHNGKQSHTISRYETHKPSINDLSATLLIRQYHNDSFSNDMMDAKSYVACTLGNDSFKEYILPKTSNKHKINGVGGVKWEKKNIKRFIDDVSDREKTLPSPSTYDTLKPLSTTKTYKISKKAKQTLIDEIMNSKHKTPGPGFYKTERKERIKGLYNFSGKGAYVGEIEYRAEQTHAPNKYSVKYDLTQDKTIIPNLNRDKSQKDTTIKKNSSPSPHSYKPDDAFDKIQVNLTKINYKWRKETENRFIDIIVKSKKQVPGVGSYKLLENALDYQYKGSTTPKFKR